MKYNTISTSSLSSEGRKSTLTLYTDSDFINEKSPSETESASIRGELESAQRALRTQTRRCKRLVAEYTKRLQEKDQQYESEKALRDDQLARVLRALLIFEARLRQEQKLISHQLNEKDYVIRKQRESIVRLSAKQYCKECCRLYAGEYYSNGESLDSSSDATYATVSLSDFAPKEEEKDTVYMKNKGGFVKRGRKLGHRKSVGTYFEVLKLRRSNESPIQSSNEDNTSNDYEQLESLPGESVSEKIGAASERIEGLFAKCTDLTEDNLGRFNESAENRNEIGGYCDDSERTEGFNKETLSEVHVDAECNDANDDSDSLYSNETSKSLSRVENAAVYPPKTEERCDANDNVLLNNDEKKRERAKINENIAVFDGGETNDNWYASASDQEDDEQRDIYRNNPVLECMNQILLQNISDNIASPPKTPTVDRKHAKSSKRVKFSDEENPPVENSANYYEIPVQKQPNFYETPQSIYSNDYEQILTQPDNPAQTDAKEDYYYVDMDTKSEPEVAARKTKIVRAPPALPPKPANLLSRYKINQQHQQDAAIDSDPDYCSISELNLPTHKIAKKLNVVAEINATAGAQSAEKHVILHSPKQKEFTDSLVVPKGVEMLSIQVAKQTPIKSASSPSKFAEASKANVPMKFTQNVETAKANLALKFAQNVETTKTNAPLKFAQNVEATKTNAPLKFAQNVEATKTNLPVKLTQNAETNKTNLQGKFTQNVEANKTNLPAKFAQNAEATKTNAPVKFAETNKTNAPVKFAQNSETTKTSTLKKFAESAKTNAPIKCAQHSDANASSKFLENATMNVSVDNSDGLNQEIPVMELKRIVQSAFAPGAEITKPPVASSAANVDGDPSKMVVAGAEIRKPNGELSKAFSAIGGGGETRKSMAGVEMRKANCDTAKGFSPAGGGEARKSFMDNGKVGEMRKSFIDNGQTFSPVGERRKSSGDSTKAFSAAEMRIPNVDVEARKSNCDIAKGFSPAAETRKSFIDIGKTFSPVVGGEMRKSSAGDKTIISSTGGEMKRSNAGDKAFSSIGIELTLSPPKHPDGMKSVGKSCEGMNINEGAELKKSVDIAKPPLAFVELKTAKSPSTTTVYSLNSSDKRKTADATKSVYCLGNLDRKKSPPVVISAEIMKSDLLKTSSAELLNKNGLMNTPNLELLKSPISSNAEIPKLPQVSEIIIPEDEDNNNEDAKNDNQYIKNDNYIKNNSQLLKPTRRSIAIGSFVSSLINTFNNQQLFAADKYSKHKTRAFAGFDQPQNTDKREQQPDAYDGFDLSQTFEEFKLDDCEIEEYNGEELHDEEHVLPDILPSPKKTASTHVEIVRATPLNPNVQHLKKKLDFDGEESPPAPKANEPSYEHFLECTGLSSKSILTPSRLLSNHKSVLKPKDVKLRSKVKSIVLENKPTSTVKYWSEPYI